MSKLTKAERTRLYEHVVNEHGGHKHGPAVTHAGHLLEGVFDHPIALAAAQAEVESGIQNIYGHDPTIFVGHGQVTKANVAQYLRARGPSGRGGMQGVGIWQLTWWSFQDAAESKGGLHLPKCQAEVYADITRGNVREWGKRSGIAHYNGSGFVAWVYAGRVLARQIVWRRRFAAALKAAEKGKR